MFAHLCLDDSVAYNPISFVTACMPKGIMPLESRVDAQNDVGEFQSLLMDRLGELFPTPTGRPVACALSPAHAAAAPPAAVFTGALGGDLFTRLFAGASTQQITGSGTCKHKSNTEEPFLCLALDVDGLSSPTIEASLSAWSKVRAGCADDCMHSA